MTTTGRSLQVSIDPNRCVGYGRCAAVSPGVFMIDDETGKAYFEEDEIERATAATIFGAARACPTQAISVEQFGRRDLPRPHECGLVGRVHPAGVVGEVPHGPNA